jgi:hypothetical protein
VKIQCDKCSAEHELDPPSWVVSSGRPFRFRCSSCGHTQSVRPPVGIEITDEHPEHDISPVDNPFDAPVRTTPMPTHPRGLASSLDTPPPAWNVTERPRPSAPTPSGADLFGATPADASAVFLKQNDQIYMVRDWVTLRRWITERRVDRNDLVSEGGVRWDPVASRSELLACFPDELPAAAHEEVTRATPTGHHFGGETPFRSQPARSTTWSDDDTEGVPIGLPPLPTEETPGLDLPFSTAEAEELGSVPRGARAAWRNSAITDASGVAPGPFDGAPVHSSNNRPDDEPAVLPLDAAPSIERLLTPVPPVVSPEPADLPLEPDLSDDDDDDGEGEGDDDGEGEGDAGRSEWAFVEPVVSSSPSSATADPTENMFSDVATAAEPSLQYDPTDLDDELDDDWNRHRKSDDRTALYAFAVVSTILIAILIGYLAWPAQPTVASDLKPANVPSPTSNPSPAPAPPAPAAEPVPAAEPAPTTEPAPAPAPEPAPAPAPEPAPAPAPAPEPAPAAPAPPPQPAPAPRAANAQATVDRGWRQVDAEDMWGAIALFDEALRASPGNAEAHYGLGYAYRQLDRPDESRRHLCSARPTATIETRREIDSLLRQNGLSCE